MNTILPISILLATLSLGLITTSAQDTGFYVSGVIGFSSQADDVSPIGQNIAVDPSFPSTFDGGDGVAGGIGVGYRYDNFRIEGRVASRQHEFDQTEEGTGERAGENYQADGEFDATSFTLEGFYDFDVNSAFSPYVKAGIGYVDTKFKTRLGGNGAAGFDAFDGTEDGFYDAYKDGSDDDFIWLVGGGVTIPTGNNVSVFGEYQYITLGSAETGQDSFTDGFQIADPAAHEVYVGLRYDF